MSEDVRTTLASLYRDESTRVTEARDLYILRKLLPRVFVSGYLVDHWTPNVDLRQLADGLQALELSRADEPEPAYITHDGLINNIGYLQSEYADFGSMPVEVLVPLSLEFPQASLEEMITTSHREASSEDIVAEIYLRQGLPQPSPALA